MSRTARSEPKQPTSSPRTIYLLCYNAISTVLWLRVLTEVFILLFLRPHHHRAPELQVVTFYERVESWTRWTQTLAIAEIIHAATGLVRAPITTTTTQIFTRCVQVWAICRRPYPADGIATSAAYPSMLFAWSVADTVRYLYFVLMMLGAGGGLKMQRVVKWLRYSLFIVLYPIGIGGEWWLMFKAARSDGTNPAVAAVLYFCLLLYVPGAFMMYTYMVKQRRKVL